MNEELSRHRPTGCSTCSTASRLTPTQRRIAHCLVQHAATAAYLSAAEVAELAGVSQPSVTRFAIALGFDGYPALRRRLRELDRPTGDARAGRRRQRVPAGGARRDRQPAAGSPTSSADPDRDRRGRRAARRQPAAAGARPARRRAAGRVLRLLRRQGPPGRAACSTRAAACSPIGWNRPRAAGATAMLAFVLPRYPREALDALREARAAGLAVVAITDSPVSPAAERADVVLPARGRHAAGLRPAHRPDGAGHGAAAGDLRRRARPRPSAGWRSSRRPPPAGQLFLG